jgi:hypothetical protein
LTLIVLLAAVVILVVLFRPHRLVKPLLAGPVSPRPDFRVVETWDLVQQGIDRMSVVALVPESTGDSALRDVLDWTLYETLDRYNRRGDRYLRVVWAYVVEDSLASKTNWRAMAIWTDPKLDEARRPAGIGGDAVKAGSVEYDFTNNYRPGEPGTGE